MTSSASFRCLPALLSCALFACTVEKDPADTGTKVECTAPSIDPLTDQAIELGDTAVVTTKATPCIEDEVTTITWSLDAKPLDSELDSTAIGIADPTSVSFKPDAVGTYVLAAYAADADGHASPVVLSVITVTSGNEPPIADCGKNKAAAENERVDMDGSASDDPEGAALTYDWSVSSAPDCSALSSSDVFNGDQAVASVVPDCAGVFVVSLVVGDATNYSEPDYCSITVASDNAAPIADAGAGETLSPCTPPDFHLNGWGSYDPDGDTLTYAWSLLSAPSGSAGDFSNDPNQPAPYFRWDIPGDYSFLLQVCDATECSAPDIVAYTFVDSSENNPPTANAGEDQTVTADPDCETASYVWTCDECPADSVTLDGSASIDDLDGDELDFFWTETTGGVTIAAPASPTTDVALPAFASTYNSAITKTWNVKLAVNDCSETDEDSVTITYTCTGTY